jgi:CrcB protein
VRNLLLVCAGGAFGSGLRYLLSLLLNQKLPIGTLLVNIVGSFLLVAVSQLFIRGALSEETKLLLTTGVMGGFTTYSSFNFEVLRFFQQGQYTSGILYLFATVSLCLVGALLGLWLFRT